MNSKVDSTFPFTTESCKLQFITHNSYGYSYAHSARIALDGGCRWIQLRMKDASWTQLMETAVAVQKMCREHNAVFIVDDNVLLAKEIKADGVHLGKSDMPVPQAREILGEGFIIGSTVNSFEDILYNLQGSAPDYFGCGPLRFTSTKKNLAPILGYEGYRNIITRMREKGIKIPLIAIGGICREDIPQLMECGVSGIALSGSVLKAANPIGEMREIVNTLNTQL